MNYKKLLSHTQISVRKDDSLKTYNELGDCTLETKKPAYTVVIFDKRNNFLARGQMVEVEGDMYSTCGSVARKGFGDLLYKVMAMVAEKENIYIAIDRLAAFAEPIEDFYENIHNSTDSISIDIDDKHSKDFFNLDAKNDFPYLFKAYQLKSTEDFRNSLVKDSVKIDNMVDETKAYFHRAYEVEDGCNRWINKELPLKKRTNNSYESDHLSI